MSKLLILEKIFFLFSKFLGLRERHERAARVDHDPPDQGPGHHAARPRPQQGHQAPGGQGTEDSSPG